MTSKNKKPYCKGVTIPGYLPKVCTDQWTFYDCTTPEMKKTVGPFETEWRERYDTLPKPYKEIATTYRCLPKLPTAGAPSSTRHKNHIYTRYTREQHGQKDVVDRIEKMIKIKCAAKLHVEKNIETHRPRKWKKICNDRIIPALILSSKTPSLEAGAFTPGQEGSKSETPKKPGEQTITDTDELENIIDMKLKNPYKGWAKPVRLNREQKAAKAKKKKAKKVEDEDDEDEDEEGGSTRIGQSLAEARLNEAVQIFCDSIACLGGEEDNIDPLTVNCLFTSGYDTTPSMSAPVSLVKSSDLPAALREAHGVPGSSRTNTKIEPCSSKTAFEKHIKADRNGYRYGAWYLKPTSWSRMKKNTKLQDPKTLHWEATMTDLDMKKREVTEELSSLRITKAFAEFISNRNARLPEFIVEAEKFCKEREEKERQKIDAEAKARQEYLNKSQRY